MPILIVFLVAIGTGAKQLKHPAVPAREPSTTYATQVLSFGAAVAGFAITYLPLSFNFTCYMRPDSPRLVFSNDNLRNSNLTGILRAANVYSSTHSWVFPSLL